MFIIAIFILLIVLFAILDRHISHRTKLRDTIDYNGEDSPRLRISVIVHRPRSINYIASLLKSESTSYQVVVVSDFSHDRTLLHDIVHYFGLFKVSYQPTNELPAHAIRSLYRSHRRVFSKIVVIDSPQSNLYTPFEVGAVVSSYNYNLQIRSSRTLRERAIENLTLELAIRPEGEIEQITSSRGERFKLICREAALPASANKIEVPAEKEIKIKYRILK